jgi:hypothetical protein
LAAYLSVGSATCFSNTVAPLAMAIITGVVAAGSSCVE